LDEISLRGMIRDFYPFPVGSGPVSILHLLKFQAEGFMPGDPVSRQTLPITEDANGSVRFKVRLTPRAAMDKIDGMRQDALKIRVKAPPVDGKANTALIKFLSKSLGISQSKITVISGHTSRVKLIRAQGISPGEVLSLLNRNSSE
ncbi:MAG: DUF167 domain-containing protein, partial [Candidatus Adiutricales bacterium]